MVTQYICSLIFEHIITDRILKNFKDSSRYKKQCQNCQENFEYLLADLSITDFEKFVDYSSQAQAAKYDRDFLKRNLFSIVNRSEKQWQNSYHIHDSC